MSWSMHRRQYLTASLALLSGCVTDTVETTEQATRKPEPTAESAKTTEQPSNISKTIDVPHDEETTQTIGRRLQLREYGWTDKELHYGTPGVTGVVKNVWNQRLAEARLEVEFYDGDTQIYNNTGWLNFLEPGEYGRLDVPLANGDPSRVTRVQITPSVRTTIFNEFNDGHLNPVNTTLSEHENGWPVASGTVINMTSAQLERVIIEVNFYDGQEVLGHSQDIIDRLGPDESGEWSNTTDRTTAEAVSRFESVITVRP